ncbi:MAG: hypothetical protein KKD01_06235 [Proteobacteria bacterium]|nr:hypothetical protein [Pseudomonadota bacterium]MBU1139037.1 hypothetical protein [Pseudomonadota bacterium]MBU1234756.1 hypothetical protein [Pseudomonadota bacterium]MBU1420658.1 hypothetical protein [Pseudomonadota bacterium]MBU1454310.1 hypothetical protein [Pseudomonadota bacterium]
MFAVIVLYLVILFFVEVVLGSCADVYNSEVGYESSCVKVTRLTSKQFFTHLLPVILLFAVFPLLLSEAI